MIVGSHVSPSILDSLDEKKATLVLLFTRTEELQRLTIGRRDKSEDDSTGTERVISEGELTLWPVSRR